MSAAGFDPGPTADVQVQSGGSGSWTLVFVRVIRHPPEKVFAALVEPDQQREWAPFVASRDLGSTGPATLRTIDGDTHEDQAEHVHRVLAPSLLEYSWGDDRLRWELEPAALGTRLTLRHTVTDKDVAPKAAAGWHLCVTVLERLLDGHPVGAIRGQAAKDYGWDELHATYAERLGATSR